MDAAVRRRALEITAKVTLSLAAASLTACAGADSRDEESGTASRVRAPEAVVFDGGVDGDGSVDASDGGHLPCGTIHAATASAEDVACCEDFLRDNTQTTQFWPGMTLAPEANRVQAASCCAVMAKVASDALGWDAAVSFVPSHAFSGACCDFPSAPLACTPWGPPMPPAMPVGFDPFADVDAVRAVA